MKIGYFYIKAGNGHYIPAKAMYEKTVEAHGADSAVLVDFYREAVKDNDNAEWTQKMWSELMLRPGREKFESWLYDHNFLWCKSIHKHFLSRKYKKPFREYITETGIDRIVVTNCVAVCIVASLVRVCKLGIPVYYYCSDLIYCYDFAARDKDITGFIAPSAECVCDLEKKHASNIVRIPIPIQNQIKNACVLDTLEAKRRLGIDEEKFCLLYQLGGEGKGRFGLLELCARNSLNVNFIILGRLSEDTQSALDEFTSEYPNISITAPGFVSNVQDYVMASDIVMSQSGLNSIAESLFLGVPVLLSLLFYVGLPMEAFIKEHGIGFVAVSAQEQYECIRKLMADRSILQDCRRNISKLEFEYDAGKAAEAIFDEMSGYGS